MQKGKKLHRARLCARYCTADSARTASFLLSFPDPRRDARASHDPIRRPPVRPDLPEVWGPMWDNREGKRNPKAPDFKCKDRELRRRDLAAPRDATAAAAAQRAPGRPRARGGAPRRRPRRARRGRGAPAAPVDATGMPLCPICGGAMWDDRASKRNPRAPDFKCRNKPRERGGPGCEGVIWPARDGSPSPYPPSARDARHPPPQAPPPWDGPPLDDGPPPDDDDLPF